MTPKYTDYLADLIYAAMLGKVPWQKFVEELGEGLPDGRSTMLFHDPARGRGKFMLTSGMDPQDVRAYNETYAPLNPWMPGAAQRARSGSESWPSRCSTQACSGRTSCIMIICGAQC